MRISRRLYLRGDDNKKAPAAPGLREARNRASVSLLGAACRIALAAVHRLPVGLIERNLRLLAAAVAGDVVESPLAPLSRGRLALVAAGLATLGLVGEPLARVELLIVGRKQKRATTVHAGEILVRVLLHHGSYRSPGFSPPGFLFPVKKLRNGICESGLRRSRRRRNKGCSRTNPLSRTRTLPRGNVRIEEGKT